MSLQARVRSSTSRSILRRRRTYQGAAANAAVRKRFRNAQRYTGSGSDFRSTNDQPIQAPEPTQLKIDVDGAEASVYWEQGDVLKPRSETGFYRTGSREAEQHVRACLPTRFELAGARRSRIRGMLLNLTNACLFGPSEAYRCKMNQTHRSSESFAELVTCNSAGADDGLLT